MPSESKQCVFVIIHLGLGWLEGENIMGSFSLLGKNSYCVKTHN